MSELLRYDLSAPSLRNALGKALSAVLSWRGSVSALLDKIGADEQVVLRAVADHLSLETDARLDKRLRLTWAEHLENQLASLVGQAPTGPKGRLQADEVGPLRYRNWSFSQPEGEDYFLRFGVREEEWRHALRSPTSVQEVTFGSSGSATFFVKARDDLDELSWTIVIVGNAPGDHQVMTTWIAFASDLEIDLDTAGPVDLMSSLAARYGYRVGVGERGWTGSFYCHSRILLADNDYDLFIPGSNTVLELGGKTEEDGIATSAIWASDFQSGTSGYFLFLAINLAQYRASLDKRAIAWVPFP